MNGQQVINHGNHGKHGNQLGSSYRGYYFMITMALNTMGYLTRNTGLGLRGLLCCYAPLIISPHYGFSKAK